MKSLKRILSYVMITIMGIFLFSGVNFKNASAEERLEFKTDKGTLFYEIYNDTVSIVDYSGEDTELVIPSEIDEKKVVCIYMEAYEGCNSLVSLIIPNSVIYIINHKLGRVSSSLRNIVISESVTDLEMSKFSNFNNLTNISVNKNNKCFSSKDGVLFNKDKSELLCYPTGKNEKLYKIPNTVTSIGEGAFSNCSNLTSITIPKSVTKIEHATFSNCNNLTIYGYKNSYAEIYANENSIPFKELTSQNLNIASFTTDKVSPQISGTKIILTTKATGGSGTLQYKFLIKDNATGNWSILREYGTSNTYTWTTKATGNKTLYVDVKDENGTVVRKSMSYTVKEEAKAPVVSNFIVDKQSPQINGTKVKLTAKATGSGTLQYKFIIKDNKKGNWYKLRDYETTNTYIWITGAKGEKTLYVDVKDGNGKVTRKSMNYVIK